jgi:predicted Holliday junction resolvase-like endonuclease
MSKKIIQELISIRGLKIECPSCFDEFSVKRGKLFNMYDAYPSNVQKILKERLENISLRRALLDERRSSLAKNQKKKPEQIETAARATNFGKISEQILPAFITFPYKQEECRVLLMPIDYVVFAGLSKSGKVEQIKFVDVKTGHGSLDRRQRKIQQCVLDGRIKHKVID